MKNHIRDTCKINMELVPPECHRRNAAEVAIHNFKAHFLSVLAGVADNFSPSLWDRLLPQTEIMINLIQQSNATPNVSVYAHLSGPFEYNKMPLALMGCEAQVHEKTNTCGTWAYHSVDGWYLFTSPEHYRTHNCHIKHTKSERLSNTVQFQHKHITNPTITHANKVMHALADCVKALQGMTGLRQKLSSSTRSPTNHRGNKNPCTGTTRPLRGRCNTFSYPQPTTSSEGANTQHVTSSEGADASKCALNTH